MSDGIFKNSKFVCSFGIAINQFKGLDTKLTFGKNREVWRTAPTTPEELRDVKITRVLSQSLTQSQSLPTQRNPNNGGMGMSPKLRANIQDRWLEKLNSLENR